jgi:hypothetical protein
VVISKNIKVDITSIMKTNVKMELDINNIDTQYRKFNLVMKKSYISFEEK